ncbi:hypothetical protein TVAG_225150 [Trichomonas vaginalis G3]|uniref:Uncharacterized protein n=1 Tax=Trichomonas vaginalis (strain ATCC PRA-98 / G3) TaxID=412133 RepID=A2GBU1_TRIV3|nr:hypothetical protein TVAGG3_0158720 [Trichomonas vaginalis G3]EAX85374.1 hypothetical protein TVAG_225150 [Trichomonas vaginalis G3]KAI5547712.1 hypothetical protein TVAGG3_0158720 [Trichomonas vaginalis G3]|eukprot:XP_001298304.1 hypothetical protein [Trichomonas vaginalis G3]
MSHESDKEAQEPDVEISNSSDTSDIKSEPDAVIPNLASYQNEEEETDSTTLEMQPISGRMKPNNRKNTMPKKSKCCRIV